VDAVVSQLLAPPYLVALGFGREEAVCVQQRGTDRWRTGGMSEYLDLVVLGFGREEAVCVQQRSMDRWRAGGTREDSDMCARKALQ